MSTSTFCRLCVRAPRTWMASGMRNYMRRSCGGRFRLRLVVRSAFADVNHRLVLGGVEAAAGDFGYEDAVVAGVDMAGGFAFKVAQGVLQNRDSAGTMRDLQVVERLRARLEALGKMLHEGLLAGADEVQHEGLALGQPIANVAAELHGDADHRRLEPGLHHPTREHAGRSGTGADCENKNAAG